MLKNVTISDKQRAHVGHDQEMNPVNNDEKKRRERRIELANNLTLASVVITAIINTVAVILKIV